MADDAVEHALEERMPRLAAEDLHLHAGHNRVSEPVRRQRELRNIVPESGTVAHVHGLRDADREHDVGVQVHPTVRMQRAVPEEVCPVRRRDKALVRRMGRLAAPCLYILRRRLVTEIAQLEVGIPRRIAHHGRRRARVLADGVV